MRVPDPHLDELNHRITLMQGALTQIASLGCKYKGTGCVYGHPNPCTPCLALEAASMKDEHD